jgi:prepilin-type N-terminal cleavage/methylation domain-containing protein
MRNGYNPARRIPFCKSAFTLIELLVVVSIIALLISILLPSLQQARAQAKAVKCAANTQHIGKAVMSYLTDSQGVYPPSYVYPKDANGDWSSEDGGQAPDPSQFGYMHWSYFLYSNGRVHDSAFQCPDFRNGGAPRTNPGEEAEDWELGEQQDAGTRTVPNDLTDKQARRMAYTANAAIIPRNKFTRDLAGGVRRTHKSSVLAPRFSPRSSSTTGRPSVSTIRASAAGTSWSNRTVPSTFSTT